VGGGKAAPLWWGTAPSAPALIATSRALSGVAQLDPPGAGIGLFVHFDGAPFGGKCGVLLACSDTRGRFSDDTDGWMVSTMRTFPV